MRQALQRSLAALGGRGEISIAHLRGAAAMGWLVSVCLTNRWGWAARSRCDAGTPSATGDFSSGCAVGLSHPATDETSTKATGERERFQRDRRNGRLPTGRYLVDRSGVPFLISGDSPQTLIGDLTQSDAALFRPPNGQRTLGSGGEPHFGSQEVGASGAQRTVPAIDADPRAVRSVRNGSSMSDRHAQAFEHSNDPARSSPRLRVRADRRVAPRRERALTQRGPVRFPTEMVKAGHELADANDFSVRARVPRSSQRRARAFQEVMTVRS